MGSEILHEFRLNDGQGDKIQLAC